jgi:hypothetical protein
LFIRQACGNEIFQVVPTKYFLTISDTSERSLQKMLDKLFLEKFNALCPKCQLQV